VAAKLKDWNIVKLKDNDGFGRIFINKLDNKLDYWIFMDIIG